MQHTPALRIRAGLLQEVKPSSANVKPGRRHNRAYGGESMHVRGCKAEGIDNSAERLAPQRMVIPKSTRVWLGLLYLPELGW